MSLRTAPRPTGRLSTGVQLLELAQDAVSLVVGWLLVALAVALVVGAVVTFFRQAGHTAFETAATTLLDRALLALILVEIVHTVRLSLRAHSLLPEPFIVVGLVAVVRRLLFLLGNGTQVPVEELGVLLGLLAAFLLGLLVVRRWGREQPEARPAPVRVTPGRRPAPPPDQTGREGNPPDGLPAAP